MRRISESSASRGCICSDRRRGAKRATIPTSTCFFDYQKGKLGLFELMDVKEYAAGILGRKTDIMTRDSLHKMLRPQIEASAIRVF